MSTRGIFTNDMDVPHPEDPENVEQLYIFKKALEDTVQEKLDEKVLQESRSAAQRSALEMKVRKKVSKVQKLIRDKEKDSTMMSILQELRHDIEILKQDVNKKLGRLSFSDAVTQNIRRRESGLPLLRVPFLNGNGPRSQIPTIQNVEMIDSLGVDDCKYLLEGYGENPTDMSKIDMKIQLRDMLGLIRGSDIRFKFS